MKKNEMSKTRLPIYFLILILISRINSAEVCEWILNTCPEGINNQIITVPSSVIALSPNIRACQTVEEFVSNDTPAIMFVIDDSRSMTNHEYRGMYQDGNDPDGNRFIVTGSLLDSIYQGQPATRVGLVVFRSGLYFDKNTHELLKLMENIPEEDSLKSQAYLPPLILDSTYSFNDGKMKGIDIIKYFLKTKNEKDSVRLAYEPGFEMVSGTNINYGFDGALQGLKTIPEPVIPLDQRYVIFLSDGEANSVSFDPRDPWAFAEAENTPTTFTVFLSNNLSTPPRRLQDFTENVRENGYSQSNPKSAIWSIRANREELMTLFMDNIIRPIMNKQVGRPKSMKINNKTSTSFKDKDSVFQFDGQIAIVKDTMKFSMEITYQVIDDKTDEKFDSVTQSSFTIVRTDKVSEPSEGSIDCWDRDVSLYYNGSPITAVNETMDKLQVVFTSSKDNYSSVTVQITHSSGNNRDKFDLPLKEDGSRWTEEFARIVAEPVTSDKILQHQASDSIIVIFRNPDNALDTIRKSYPFSINKKLSFPAAYYYDSNADGFIDSIFIEVEGAISSDDISTLKQKITLPSERKFTTDSIKVVKGGLVYHVKEGGSKEPKTYVSLSDVIMIDNGTLPDGGLVTENILKVKDRVAPVLLSGKLFQSGDSDSLQVVFSEPVDEFSSSMPFLFSTADGKKKYSVELENKGILVKKTTYTARVVTVELGYTVSTGDSIWINPNAEINDTNDNIQKKDPNRKVRLDVKARSEIVISVVNNPLKPGDKIPEIVRKTYETKGASVPNNGLVIVIKTKGKAKGQEIISGTASIYDVVKNPVTSDDIIGIYDEYLHQLYFIWDGHNSNGRLVGTGTYTAFVKISVKNSRTGEVTLNSSSKVRIGISRKE